MRNGRQYWADDDGEHMGPAGHWYFLPVADEWRFNVAEEQPDDFHVTSHEAQYVVPRYPAHQIIAWLQGWNHTTALDSEHAGDILVACFKKDFKV